MLALVAVLLLCNILVASSQSVAVATFNSTGPGAGVSGTVTFSYTSTGALQVQVSLSGLSATAGVVGHNWHVHVSPFDTSITDSSACETVGYHFDPFNTNWPNQTSPNYVCSPSNLSTCEAGDLSGKLGLLPANGSYTYNYTDTSGTLRVSDCAGRSVVIHQMPSPPASVRYRVCANVYGVTTTAAPTTAGALSVMDGAKLVVLLALLLLAIA